VSTGPASAVSLELTIGELIDRLAIENVRLWHLQDAMTVADDRAAANAARATTEANTRRVALRAEITRRLEGRGDDGTRVYGHA